jgi:hypothetical protein
MLKELCLGAFLLLSMSTMAQTKRIAHRSHGGGNRHFTPGGEGNWGLPSDNEEKKKLKPAKTVDTIKMIPYRKPSKKAVRKKMRRSANKG